MRGAWRGQWPLNRAKKSDTALLTKEDHTEINTLRKRKQRAKTKREHNKLDREYHLRLKEIYARNRAEYESWCADHYGPESPADWKIERGELGVRWPEKPTLRRCRYCDYVGSNLIRKTPAKKNEPKGLAIGLSYDLGKGFVSIASPSRDRDLTNSLRNENIKKYPAATRVEPDHKTGTLICTECIKIICKEDETEVVHSKCYDPTLFVKPISFTLPDVDLTKLDKEDLKPLAGVSPNPETPPPDDEDEDDDYEEWREGFGFCRWDHLRAPERRWSEAQGEGNPEEDREPASARAFSYRDLWKDQIAGPEDPSGPPLRKVLAAYSDWHKNPKKYEPRVSKFIAAQ